MTEMDLALVDIEPFIRGDDGDRRRVARAFGDAFETTGFAVIVGHGVPETLATDLYDCVSEFFGRSYSEKSRFTPPEKAKLADTVKHIEDDGLRASLERLGATILGKKR